MATDMRRWALAPLLLNLAKAASLRPIAIKLALKMEGGDFYSRTARELIARYYHISIGDYSYGSCFDHDTFAVENKRGVVIGRYVSIAEEVRVFTRNHPMDRLSTHPFFFNKRLGYVSEDQVASNRLEIASDAWIGARTIILRGCSRVGVGAVIGAGSIVTKDIPDFAIAAGNPARVIRFRFPPELRQEVLASRWWEKSVTECARHLSDMTAQLQKVVTNHPLILQP